MITTPEYTIYIPTLGRIKSQITWDRLPPRVRARTYLLVSKEEAPEHTALGRRVLVCPAQGKGLTAVRQWMLENSQTDVLMTLDDDLRIQRRKSDDDWHMHNLDPTNKVDALECERMFDLLAQLLCQGYVHGWVSKRQGNNTLGNDVYGFFGRVCRCYGMLKPAVDALGVKFHTKLLQDFDFTLQLLRRGYINPQLYRWAADNGATDAKPGGVQLYRTREMLLSVFKDLQERHPGCIQQVRHEGQISPWRKFTGGDDIEIRWKTAWDSAAVKHGNWNDPRFLALVGGLPKQDLFGAGRTPSGHALPKMIQQKRKDRIEEFPFTVERWNLSMQDPQVAWRWSF